MEAFYALSPLRKPLEALQVFTWVLLVSLVCGFYAFIVPPMEEPLGLIMSVLYGVLAALCVLTGGVVSWIDPIDPLLEKALEGTQGSRHGSQVENSVFCFLCQVHVKRGSKHCRYCDKCVDNFDHHCKWLNNCIGLKNYRYFVALLGCALALTSLQLALSIWHIVLFHTDNSDFEERVSISYPNLDIEDYIVAVYVFGGICVPFVGLLIQLLLFHARLLSEGLTTYDFIVREQKRERDKKQKLRDRQQAMGAEPPGVPEQGRWRSIWEHLRRGNRQSRGVRGSENGSSTSDDKVADDEITREESRLPQPV